MSTGKQNFARQVVIVIAMAVVVLIGIVLSRDRSSKQVLRDGNILILSGVKIGQTNLYEHGTRVSKLFGRLIPSNGIRVAGLKLNRPRKVGMFFGTNETLAAELQLQSASARQSELTNPAFYRKYRLLITGDDGYAFIRELFGFKQFEDGVFDQILTPSFPRDSRRLHFHLEARENPTTREWREVAVFDVKNPKRSRVASWKAESSPRFKIAGEMEVEIGELTVRHQPIHPTDIWENTATLPIRITRGGQAVTNWGLLDGDVQDASGNFDKVPADKIMTNEWMSYRMFRPLDPAKLWRFQLRIGRDADFPATNLFTFAVPFPLGGPVVTNLGGFPCRIEFVNTTMLSVELMNQPAGVRLSFVKAVDDLGNNLDDWSGSWRQHRFWKSLKVRDSLGPRGSGLAQMVHATVAIRREYEIEFVLRPRDETKAR